MEEQEIRLKAYEMALNLTTKIWEANNSLGTANDRIGTGCFLDDVLSKQEAIMADMVLIEVCGPSEDIEG